MKKFLFKSMTLATILIGIQVLFAYSTDYKDVPSTVRVLEDALDENVDVLFLGDSTLYRGDYSQPDQRTTPEMVADLLPDKVVCGVYHDAYHLELLEYFAKNAANHPNKPSVIIMPINMRSFSAERTRRPEYQFVKVKLFLANQGILFRTFFRPLAAFRAFDLNPVTQEEYLDLEMFDGDTRLGTFRDLRAIPVEEGLPLHLRACYRYQLDFENRHIKALDRIAKLCSEKGIELIVYSTPTDYERGDEAIGTDFSDGIRRNLNEVEETLARYDIPLVNLTFEYPKEAFVHGTYPDAYIYAEIKLEVAELLVGIVEHVE